MRIGMVGLGRMGANMVRRLLDRGHECVVYDHAPEAVEAAVRAGAAGAASLEALCTALPAPRVLWIMVPAAAVDAVIAAARARLGRGDVLIDGGNSHYRDDIRRARELAADGIHYLDVGTSGGVLGLTQGYCLMVGGETETVRRLEPVFEALAPGPATDASPAPRKIPLLMNNRTIAAHPPKATDVKVCPMATTAGLAPIARSIEEAKIPPGTPMHTATRHANTIACTAAIAAPRGSFSPTRLATMAVADNVIPSAAEKTRVSIDSVSPTVATAFAPNLVTQNTSTIANNASISISNTMGVASSNTARLMEPSVKS